VAWRRLSVRAGKRQPRGPYEGIPPHLINPIAIWIRRRFVDPRQTWRNVSELRYVALMNEVIAPPGSDERHLLEQMLDQCVNDPDFCLDLLDSILRWCALTAGDIDELSTLLTFGSSVWDVAPDHVSLVKRVDLWVPKTYATR
jgi:hypothetical protein